MRRKVTNWSIAIEWYRSEGRDPKSKDPSGGLATAAISRFIEVLGASFFVTVKVVGVGRKVPSMYVANPPWRPARVITS